MVTAVPCGRLYATATRPNLREEITVTKTITALDAFTELRTLVGDTPEDYPLAWTRARDLVAIVEKARGNGQLADELAEKKNERRHVKLEEQIRADLAEVGFADAVGVIFTTMEHDDGYYLNERSASVYDADGVEHSVDFSDDVDELLTSLFGTVGRHAGFGFNLLTGASDFDDDADNVPGFIGIKVSK